jgi:hypothetical protein
MPVLQGSALTPRIAALLAQDARGSLWMLVAPCAHCFAGSASSSGTAPEFITN